MTNTPSFDTVVQSTREYLKTINMRDVLHAVVYADYGELLKRIAYFAAVVIAFLWVVAELSYEYGGKSRMLLLQVSDRFSVLYRELMEDPGAVKTKLMQFIRKS